MKSGYWQVDIDENDRYKTAFSIPGGQQWQWKRLAFGLCNAPATFTRLMQMVFNGLLWKFIIIYLDDIICHSKTFEQQFENLEVVFNRLSVANLKLNPKKCVLFQKEVTFLGHVISENGVGTDPRKIDKIRNWPTPKNTKEARSFISLASYYRSYVYQFAKIAKPLHELSENGRKFVWTVDCEKAFQKMKEVLTNAPILAFPTENDQFILDTDASLSAQGGVLSQRIDGKEKVIGYFSKCFTKTERRYCVTRRELLAVVNSVKHFHHYLYGRHVIIRVDHSSLSWLMNFKNVEGQLARWLTFISSYDFTIEHRAGRLHSNADALSRRPCIEENCKHCKKVEDNIENSTMVSHIQVSETIRKGDNCENMCNKGDNSPIHDHSGCSTFLSLALILIVSMTDGLLLPSSYLMMFILWCFHYFNFRKTEKMKITENTDNEKCLKHDFVGDSQIIKGVNSENSSVSHNVDKFSSSNLDFSKLSKTRNESQILSEEKGTKISLVDNTCHTDKDNVLIGSIDTSSTSQTDDQNQVDKKNVEFSFENFDIAEIQDKDSSLKIIKDLIMNGIKTDWNEISQYSPEVKILLG